MPWGAIAGAAISGAASLIGGKKQNEASRDASERQMAFQENSAKHQYQWAMQDMKSAGLNPMLAYSQGGTGTLSGSTYQPVNEMMGIPSAVNSAFSNKKIVEELDNLKETNKLIRDQQNNTTTDTYLKNVEAMNKSSATELNRAAAKEKEAQTDYIRSQEKIAGEVLNSAKRDSKQAEIDLKTLEDVPWARRLGALMRELGFGGKDVIPRMLK